MYEVLEVGVNKVRDSFTLLLQLLALLIGDKKKYERKLEEAHGAHISEEERSRLFQRYHKVIGEKFKDVSFHSINAIETQVRGRK